MSGGNATQGSVNYSWDLNGQATVASVETYGSSVYVGLGLGVSDAEVWEWDGSAWSKIGGDGTGVSPSTLGWQDGTYEEVTALETDTSGNLYAGLGINNTDAEVWRWDGSVWEKIGGDGTGATPSAAGWASGSPGPYENVTSLVHDGTYLYVGLGTSQNDAEVWRWDGSVWEKIGGDNTYGGWAAGFDDVYSLATDGTYVYAGLGVTAGEAEVWRWNGSDDWDKIGGDTVGWDGTNFEAVLALYTDGTTLYAGLGTGTNDADVYKCTLTNCVGTWSLVAGNGTGWADGTYDRVASITGDGTNVFIGMGVNVRDADIWSYDGATLTKIAGDGTGWANDDSFRTVRGMAYSTSTSTLYAGIYQSNGAGELHAYNLGSWSRVGGNYKNKSWGYYGLNSVESMVRGGEYLYAGTGRTTTAVRNISDALVFQFDGTTWGNLPIGGLGLNGSWDSTTLEHEFVHSLEYFNNSLYAGLGYTTGDAEIWRFNGTDDWDLVAGDGTGWGAGYESVLAMLSYKDALYAGLGTGSGDGEVWRYTTGGGWGAIANGNAASEGVSGWTTGNNQVSSFVIYNDILYAGLGSGNDDADIWSYNGTWTKVKESNTLGVGYDSVESMAVYKGDLYVGLGTGVSEADVFKYDGSTWTQIGGDGDGSTPSQYGWDSSYERVRSLVVYNGELYAGLGDSGGDGEVWKYNGSQWTKVGGDGASYGWGGGPEYVNALQVYKGRLFAATGYTVNADAMIWAWGDNSSVSSTQSAWDSDEWYHIAATYDGLSMELNVTPLSTGTTTTNTFSTSLSMSDNQLDLLAGVGYGSDGEGTSGGYFDGLMDEARVSSINRTSFIKTPFSAEAQSVSPDTPVFTQDVAGYLTFASEETPDGASISYRLSDDGGSSWKYWHDGSWVTSVSLLESNTESDINSHITAFPVTEDGILWQVVFDGDGTEQPEVSGITVTANPDTQNPGLPTTLSVLSEEDGISLSSGTWYDYVSPYFSWSGAVDQGDAGIAGYYVYFGTDQNAELDETWDFQVEEFFVPDSMTSGTPYYFKLIVKDNAQNLSAEYPEVPFEYKFDSLGSSLPKNVTVTPPGYTAVNEYTFMWPSEGVSAASDCTAPATCSGISGYQYKSGATEGAYSSWSETITETQVTLTDVAYQDKVNYLYLRVLDNAGNVSEADGEEASYQIPFYYAGTAPTAPTSLGVSPETSELSPSAANMFTFTWEAPENFSGSQEDLAYCYTVNEEPEYYADSDTDNCTYTGAGVTGAGPQAFANKPGRNVFYVAAKDEVGNINYDAVETKEFYVGTSAPGIPLNVEIADVSVKSTSSWKLATSWEPPTTGTVAKYEVHRSVDNVNFSRISSIEGGISHVDTGLQQQTYYYKIRACDNTNNCGAFSTVVSLLPTGKFTDAPLLTAEPIVYDITTKKAAISWSTNRLCDTKVQFGTSSGDYLDEEPSNSDQVTEHEILLNNLSPGTGYYFTAKWTDEDGNTGMSEEIEFSTAPAPVVTDPSIKKSGIDLITLQFTVAGASKIRIYYGETSAFGGTRDLSTSTSEATYDVVLEGLKDGTKYFYKINTFDTEGSEYEGNILSFETMPRPKITNVKITQIKGTAKPSVLVSWETNTQISSIITHYPVNDPSQIKDLVNVAMTLGKHRMVLENLSPETTYAVVVKGQDRAGNEARSDSYSLTTAADTRAPAMENLKVEGGIVSVSGSGEKLAQLVVSWDTDEPSTAQIEFGEGTGSNYSQKTQEDSGLAYNHVVVISNLVPSKVYHFRAISKDRAGNEARSVDTVTITPKATANALDLVVSNLQQVFGFIQ